MKQWVVTHHRFKIPYSFSSENGASDFVLESAEAMGVPIAQFDITIVQEDHE